VPSGLFERCKRLIEGSGNAGVIARETRLPRELGLRVFVVRLFLRELRFGLREIGSGLIARRRFVNVVEREQEIPAFDELTALDAQMREPAGRGRADQRVVAFALAEPWLRLLLSACREKEKKGKKKPFHDVAPESLARPLSSTSICVSTKPWRS
jgi:hypothetical protein